jgi:hypothetical protein
MIQLSSIVADTDDFLFNSPNGYDTFVLKVTGFTANGQPVSVPGLNSDYSLYFEGTVAVSGNPSVYGPGTISLLLDPTNNDGTPSATFNPSTQSGGVGFSNAAGTADDITLASGQFVSGTFGTQSNGQPGLMLVNTFNPSPSLSGLLNGGALNIQTLLSNTATSRTTGTTDIGATYVLSNDGIGIVSLQSASGSSDTVSQSQIVGDLDYLQFLHGSHR